MSSGCVGFIEAWPNPCPIFEGNDSGITGLSWTAVCDEAEITLQPVGGKERVLSRETSGGETLADVRLGDQYTARLYEISDGQRRLLASLILASRAAPAAVVASGKLSASPNPCRVGGEADRGTALVSWRTHCVRQAQVTLQIDALAEDVFAEGLGGERAFTRLRPGYTYCFRLYDVSGSTRVLLDSLEVSAQTGARIEATPNPCLIPGPGVQGLTSLAWATPGDAPTEVTLQERDSEEAPFSTVPRGHLPFTGIHLGSWYVFRLYDTSRGTRRLVDSVVVTGAQIEPARLKQGRITATPTLCRLDRQDRPGTTVISWSTQNVPAVEVTMQTGDAETLLASAVTGTRTVSEIRNDKPYVFRLYDVSGPSRRLLDGVVVAAL